MVLLLVLIVLPILFCMLSWVLYTASRLFAAEDALALELGAYQIRRRSLERRRSVAVGSSVIGDEMRFAFLPMISAYSMRNTRSSGIPTAWHDDIWLRRN